MTARNIKIFASLAALIATAASASNAIKSGHETQTMAGPFKYNTVLFGKLEAKSDSLDVCVSAAPLMPDKAKAPAGKAAESGCEVVPQVSYSFSSVVTLVGATQFSARSVRVVSKFSKSTSDKLVEGNCYVILADVPKERAAMRAHIKLTAPDNWSIFEVPCRD